MAISDLDNDGHLLNDYRTVQAIQSQMFFYVQNSQKQISDIIVNMQQNPSYVKLEPTEIAYLDSLSANIAAAVVEINAARSPDMPPVQPDVQPEV